MVLKCYLQCFSIKSWQELNQNYVAAPRKQNNFSGPGVNPRMLSEPSNFFMHLLCFPQKQIAFLFWHSNYFCEIVITSFSDEITVIKAYFIWIIWFHIQSESLSAALFCVILVVLMLIVCLWFGLSYALLGSSGA